MTSDIGPGPPLPRRLGRGQGRRQQPGGRRQAGGGRGKGGAGVRIGVEVGGWGITDFPSSLPLMAAPSQLLQVLSITTKGQRITALALNPSRKLMAFTEHGERPLLIVYDLERRKRLKLLRCAEFRSLEVMGKFKHLSCL